MLTAIKLFAFSWFLSASPCSVCSIPMRQINTILVYISLTSQTRKPHKTDGNAHSFILWFLFTISIVHTKSYPNEPHASDGQIGNINDHSSRNWQWINDICTINRFIAVGNWCRNHIPIHSFDRMKFNCRPVLVCVPICIWKVRPCCVTLNPDSKLNQHIDMYLHETFVECSVYDLISI